jgi:tartrate/fumarate subfamily iron-sulfur-dependent hydro-lyase alpha chain
MITKEIMEAAIFETVTRSSCELSKDVHAAFESAIRSEKRQRAKEAFETTLQSMDQSAKVRNPLCPDTGWPLFFSKVGNEAKIEGGVLALEEVAKGMVEKATKEGYLRSTMKHPLSGDDPGTNVGMNIPGFTYKFVPGNALQITYVAKGGGSECFGGTRYRMVAFADGLMGIEKSIIDWYIAAARAGAICPPSILGVGIGGTADIATKLAKEAAVLRIIGSHHPESVIAKIEEDLTAAINKLGIGPMGSGGTTSVFAVNVEYSLTHIAGIAVAMSANCWVGRRATTMIRSDGKIEALDNPNWFNGR